MTGRLRSLADQAIGPTPWLVAESEVLGVTTADYSYDIAYDIGPESAVDAQATARLIALAPEMARLLADMADTIRRDWKAAGCLDPECPCAAGKVAALLARFRELEERA